MKECFARLLQGAVGQRPHGVPQGAGFVPRPRRIPRPSQACAERAPSRKLGPMPTLERATPDALDHHIGSTVLTLPPLRERGGDLEKWADYFLLRCSQRLSVRPPRLSADALAALRRQRWPGNLIELEAVLSRATCLTAKTVFDAEDIGLPSTAKGEPVFLPLFDAVDRFKADYIARALAHFSGNRTRTAAALSVDVRTIFRMIRAEGASGRVSGDEPE